LIKWGTGRAEKEAENRTRSWPKERPVMGGDLARKVEESRVTLEDNVRKDREVL